MVNMYQSMLLKTLYQYALQNIEGVFFDESDALNM